MESNSQDQSQQWVENAKNYYRSTGRKLALAEFSDPNGMFVRDEMYIFVLDFEGTMLAHGINSKYVGENFTEVKDPDGRFFIKEIIEAANMEPNGWVEYKWFNPATKEWDSKTTYFEVVDDLILCGGHS